MDLYWFSFYCSYNTTNTIRLVCIHEYIFRFQIISTRRMFTHKWFLLIDIERAPNWNWHIWIIRIGYVCNETQYGTSAFTIFPVPVNESCIVTVYHDCFRRLLRESGVVLIMVSLLLWFYQCFVFYSTPARTHWNRFREWECRCDANSWRNSNRCQTNSTLLWGC